MILGAMTMELARTGTPTRFFVQVGLHRLVTDVTLDELEQLATQLAHEAMAWRRERNRVNPDWYGVLNIPRTATGDEIRDAYRTLAKQYHPDTSASDSHGVMTQLNDAYAVLGDPQSRQQYDATFTP